MSVRVYLSPYWVLDPSLNDELDQEFKTCIWPRISNVDNVPAMFREEEEGTSPYKRDEAWAEWTWVRSKEKEKEALQFDLGRVHAGRPLGSMMSQVSDNAPRFAKAISKFFDKAQSDRSVGYGEKEGSARLYLKNSDEVAELISMLDMAPTAEMAFTEAYRNALFAEVNSFVANTDTPSPPAADSGTSGGTVPVRPVAPSFAKRYYTILVVWWRRIGITVCLLFALYICLSLARIFLQNGQKQRERHNPQQGVPSVQRGQPGSTTKGMAHGAATFEDDFTLDHSLNQSIWTTDGEALNARILKADTTFVPVRLAFSSLGMSMAGVDGKFQSTGIQSARSCSTPLTLEAKVMGTIANGNAFALYLVNADGSQYLTLNGHQDRGNGDDYSLGLGYTGLANDAGNGMRRVLSRDVSLHAWNVIRFTVDAHGVGTVVVEDLQGSRLAAENNLTVGTGPFFVVLAQWEGWPHTVGPNEAVWGKVTISTALPEASR
jgi:hypothetical protein